MEHKIPPNQLLLSGHGASLRAVQEVFADVRTKRDVVSLLSNQKALQKLRNISISQAPSVSVNQAEKDFHRERVLLNDLPFIPDKNDEFRCQSFCLTLRILVERLCRQFSRGFCVDDRSSIEFSNLIMQRGCRTSAGADSFFATQSIFCVEGSFLTQNTNKLYEAPVVIDVFITDDGDDAMDGDDDDGEDNEQRGSRETGGTRTSASTVDPRDRSRSSAIGIGSLLDDDKDRGTGTGTGIGSLLDDDKDRGAGTETGTATQSPVNRSRTPFRLHRDRDQGRDNNDDDFSNDSPVLMHHQIAPVTKHSTMPRPSFHDKSQQDGGEDSERKCGGGVNTVSVPGRSAGAGVQSLCARSVVRNAFALYDESAMDSIAGNGGSEPLPWLEIETVVVDETNFRTGEHSRKMQIILSLPSPHIPQSMTVQVAGPPSSSSRRPPPVLNQTTTPVSASVVSPVPTSALKPSPPKQQQQCGEGVDGNANAMMITTTTVRSTSALTADRPSSSTGTGTATVTNSTPLGRFVDNSDSMSRANNAAIGGTSTGNDNDEEEEETLFVAVEHHKGVVGPINEHNKPITSTSSSYNGRSSRRKSVLGTFLGPENKIISRLGGIFFSRRTTGTSSSGGNASAVPADSGSDSGKGSGSGAGLSRPRRCTTGTADVMEAARIRQQERQRQEEHNRQCRQQQPPLLSRETRSLSLSYGLSYGLGAGAVTGAASGSIGGVHVHAPHPQHDLNHHPQHDLNHHHQQRMSIPRTAPPIDAAPERERLSLQQQEEAEVATHTAAAPLDISIPIPSSIINHNNTTTSTTVSSSLLVNMSHMSPFGQSSLPTAPAAPL